MDLPKAGSTYTQERRGIAAVQGYAAKTGQIWRETGTGDVGSTVSSNLSRAKDSQPGARLQPR